MGHAQIWDVPVPCWGYSQLSSPPFQGRSTYVVPTQQYPVQPGAPSFYPGASPTEFGTYGTDWGGLLCLPLLFHPLRFIPFVPLILASLQPHKIPLVSGLGEVPSVTADTTMCCFGILGVLCVS